MLFFKYCVFFLCFLACLTTATSNSFSYKDFFDLFQLFLQHGRISLNSPVSISLPVDSNPGICFGIPHSFDSVSLGFSSYLFKYNGSAPTCYDPLSSYTLSADIFELVEMRRLVEQDISSFLRFSFDFTTLFSTTHFDRKESVQLMSLHLKLMELEHDISSVIGKIDTEDSLSFSIAQELSAFVFRYQNLRLAYFENDTFSEGLFLPFSLLTKSAEDLISNIEELNACEEERLHNGYFLFTDDCSIFPSKIFELNETHLAKYGSNLVTNLDLSGFLHVYSSNITVTDFTFWTGTTLKPHRPITAAHMYHPEINFPLPTENVFVFSPPSVAPTDATVPGTFCALDYYMTAEGQKPVGVGFYSPLNDCERYHCTGLDSGMGFSTMGGGVDDCNTVCLQGGYVHLFGYCLKLDEVGFYSPAYYNNKLECQNAPENAHYVLDFYNNNPTCSFVCEKSGYYRLNDDCVVAPNGYWSPANNNSLYAMSAHPTLDIDMYGYYGEGFSVNTAAWSQKHLSKLVFDKGLPIPFSMQMDIMFENITTSEELDIATFGNIRIFCNATAQHSLVIHDLANGILVSVDVSSCSILSDLQISASESMVLIFMDSEIILRSDTVVQDPIEVLYLGPANNFYVEKRPSYLRFGISQVRFFSSVILKNHIAPTQEAVENIMFSSDDRVICAVVGQFFRVSVTDGIFDVPLLHGLGKHVICTYVFNVSQATYEFTCSTVVSLQLISHRYIGKVAVSNTTTFTNTEIYQTVSPDGFLSVGFVNTGVPLLCPNDMVFNNGVCTCDGVYWLGTCSLGSSSLVELIPDLNSNHRIDRTTSFPVSSSVFCTLNDEVLPTTIVRSDILTIECLDRVFSMFARVKATSPTISTTREAGATRITSSPVFNVRCCISSVNSNCIVSKTAPLLPEGGLVIFQSANVKCVYCPFGFMCSDPTSVFARVSYLRLDDVPIPFNADYVIRQGQLAFVAPDNILCFDLPVVVNDETARCWPIKKGDSTMKYQAEYEDESWSFERTISVVHVDYPTDFSIKTTPSCVYCSDCVLVSVTIDESHLSSLFFAIGSSRPIPEIANGVPTQSTPTMDCMWPGCQYQGSFCVMQPTPIHFAIYDRETQVTTFLKSVNVEKVHTSSFYIGLLLLSVGIVLLVMASYSGCRLHCISKESYSMRQTEPDGKERVLPIKSDAKNLAKNGENFLIKPNGTMSQSIQFNQDSLDEFNEISSVSEIDSDSALETVFSSDSDSDMQILNWIHTPNNNNSNNNKNLNGQINLELIEPVYE
ncbi:hypothetical protein PCE1_002465 [Barthelona sp. PCE]